jgi:hypothetical protein
VHAIGIGRAGFSAYSPEKKAADFGIVRKCDKSGLLPTNN